MKLIERPLYLDRLKRMVGTPDIKIITGVRRAGKSKLLESFRAYVEDSIDNANVIYADLSLIEFEELKEHHALYDYVSSNQLGRLENSSQHPISTGIGSISPK